MARLSLLQISDLHLLDPADPSYLAGWFYACGHRQTPAEALADFIRARGDLFNTILITGDVADTGEANHLQYAHKFLYPGSASTNCGFVGVEHDVHLMPGNHDRYFEPLRTPGNTLFDQVFAKQWRVGYGRAQAVVLGVPGATSDLRVCVVCGDFCLQQWNDSDLIIPGSYMGQGTAAHPLVLSEMEDLTNAARSAAKREGGYCAVVWAIHFPPTHDGKVKAPLRLRHKSRVLRAARRLDVPLILSGHVHAPLPFNVGTGDPVVWTAGSATATNALSNTVHAVDFAFDEQVRRIEISRRNFEFDGVSMFQETIGYTNHFATPAIAWNY